MATKTFKLNMDDISQALGQYLVDEGKLSEGVEGGTIISTAQMRTVFSPSRLDPVKR